MSFSLALLSVSAAISPRQIILGGVDVSSPLVAPATDLENTASDCDETFAGGSHSILRQGAPPQTPSLTRMDIFHLYSWFVGSVCVVDTSKYV